MAYYGKSKSDTKFDEDLITSAELHLQRFFQEEIGSRYPGHRVFKGDPVESEYTHEGKRYLWVCDPIDGADNFQAGIPVWGMSIALLEKFLADFRALPHAGHRRSFSLRRRPGGFSGR